jgi:hypothetical protein
MASIPRATPSRLVAKPGAVLDDDDLLAEALAEGAGGGEHVGARALGHHHLEQLHHVHRVEEVGPDHPPRIGDGRRDRRDRQRARVRSEHAAGGGQGRDLGQEPLLEVEPLRDGLDHEVRAGGRRREVSGRQAGERQVADLGRHLALGDALVEVGAHGRRGLGELTRVGVGQHHRHPRHGRHLGDAVPHRARADHADAHPDLRGAT